MKTGDRPEKTLVWALSLAAPFVAALLGTVAAPLVAEAAFPWIKKKHHHHAPEPPVVWDPAGGQWYWLRSPEQERRVITNLFNRYCIRCHGVDGRGVWDIPDVPDFSNPHWQVTRNDGELSRAILEGRGACMPPFRGTLTLEEACAMAHYVRTFVPGTEVPRPRIDRAQAAPANATAPSARVASPPALPDPTARAPFAR